MKTLQVQEPLEFSSKPKNVIQLALLPQRRRRRIDGICRALTNSKRSAQVNILIKQFCSVFTQEDLVGMFTLAYTRDQHWRKCMDIGVSNSKISLYWKTACPNWILTYYMMECHQDKFLVCIFMAVILCSQRYLAAGPKKWLLRLEGRKSII